ncbi:MAG: hypothetical protein NTU53_23965 [Planctomycetota bacterium]|nr:hypothetical protein [Planctomycetota bacterium]
MTRGLIVGMAAASLLVMTGVGMAAGISSAGNVDGVLTWKLGDIGAGQSARQVVLFAFDQSYEKAAKILEEGRRQFVKATDPAARSVKVEPTVWIGNDATDFAMEAFGSFFWEGGRQCLKCAHGGQLSRLGWYVHYSDPAAKRAGTPIAGDRNRVENLEMIERVAFAGPQEAWGTVRTTDQQMQIRIRAMMGNGTVVGVEYVVSNAGQQKLTDVKLSVYSNLEAAHDHENDYGVLDPATGALVLVDPPTGMCVMIAGLDRPYSGYCGLWASEAQLRAGSGLAFDQWKVYAGIPAATKKALMGDPRSAGVYAEYAPAPPVTEPTEPETRTLSKAEAKDTLERDWMYQAEGKPLLSRTVEEIRWARELARRLAKDSRTADLAKELVELDELEKQLGEPARTKDVYLAARRVKRRIMFRNPAVDFSQMLFIDNPYPAGREWQHQARHRNGMMAVPGGRLFVLDGLGPDGKLLKLAPAKPGSFWRPDLSFDGNRVLFCYQAFDEKSFHLYEINVDGTGLRQLTHGPYDDIDPIYLPDGHIIFSTTRSNTYVRCMPYTYSYVLARCDWDGGNVYLISHNNEPDWCPALLNDGRLIYSRWEYTDKALWRIESLWTTNQDGTGTAAFWGNQSVWPDHLAEPRAIPGSRRVMFTALAHHNWFAGSIGIIDPAKGMNFPMGLTKVTCETPWPECGQPPIDPHETADYHTAGQFGAYKTPYPLSEEDFLVSAERGGKFVLYLMDVHGNRELIYEGAHNVWHAMPLKARPVPPMQASRVAWPGTGVNRTSPEDGTFFSANVLQGVPQLAAGKAKYLRVIQMDAKTYSLWTRDSRTSGPGISILQDDGVKRILGTVPVEADGSVNFRAPSGIAMHFQLLDEHGRALQTMRSFTGVMPGEQRGCVGCHEMHSTAPVNGGGVAMRRAAANLKPPAWGTTSISYERMVQPVLDQYCVSCHQSNAEAKKKIDLALRPGQLFFKEPYVSLVGPVGFGVAKQKHSPGIAGALMVENYEFSDPDSYVTFPPMMGLSYRSKLIDLAMSGKHYDAVLDEVSLQKLIVWVDANCPYRGDEDVRAILDPAFPGVEDLPIRPLCKSAPVISRP